MPLPDLVLTLGELDEQIHKPSLELHQLYRSVLSSLSVIGCEVLIIDPVLKPFAAISYQAGRG